MISYSREQGHPILLSCWEERSWWAEGPVLRKETGDPPQWVNHTCKCTQISVASVCLDQMSLPLDGTRSAQFSSHLPCCLALLSHHPVFHHSFKYSWLMFCPYPLWELIRVPASPVTWGDPKPRRVPMTSACPFRNSQSPTVLLTTFFILVPVFSFLSPWDRVYLFTSVMLFPYYPFPQYFCTLLFSLSGCP